MATTDTSQLTSWFSALPTDRKLIAVMSVALAPLGIIATLAAIQSSRTVDLRRAAFTRIVTAENARSLGGLFSADLAVGAASLDGLRDKTRQVLACDRVLASFENAMRAPSQFYYRSADFECGAPPPGPLPDDPVTLQPTGAYLRLTTPPGERAVVFVPRATLAQLTRPVGITVAHSAELIGQGQRLVLHPAKSDWLQRVERAEAPVGAYGLRLRATIDSVAFSASDALSALLPLLMWASAATVAFLIVERLLTRPLRKLREAVDSLRPGDAIQLETLWTPAKEIDALAGAIGAFGTKAREYEADLTEALEQQRKLTREVHHRVKNNLQIVASLISLNARGATTPEASAAYIAIQRRVDALAIVHRNRFAETEENLGVSLRALVAELTSSLRMSVVGRPPTIKIDVGDLRVHQDTAIPLAFLTTELFEIAHQLNASAPMAITARATGDRRAEYCFASDGMRDEAALEAALAGQHGRILQGLARQMRAPLDRSADGAFAIAFST